MSVLTIQAPAQRGRSPRRVDVPVGRSATFGTCGCGACDLDLPLLSGPPVPFRGEVRASPSRWRVANLGDALPIRVVEVDSGRRSVLWPGEEVPFEHDMATVAPGTADAAGVTVFFTAEPVPARSRPCPALRTGVAGDPGPRLDPGARHVAVLRALCGPVLAGQPAATSGDIAGRLGLSRRAVDAHVDYLVEKLAIAAPAVRATGWKRRALLAHVHRRPGLAEFLRATGGGPGQPA